MEIRKLIPLIPLISVLIMFVWGWLEGSFEHSWIAVMAGGMLSGYLYSVQKKQDAQEKDEDKKDSE